MAHNIEYNTAKTQRSALFLPTEILRLIFRDATGNLDALQRFSLPLPCTILSASHFLAALPKPQDEGFYLNGVQAMARCRCGVSIRVHHPSRRLARLQLRDAPRQSNNLFSLRSALNDEGGDQITANSARIPKPRCVHPVGWHIQCPFSNHSLKHAALQFGI